MADHEAMTDGNSTAIEEAIRRLVQLMIDEAIASLRTELDTLKRTPERQPWKDRKEAAAYLSCSTTKIDDMAANGRLPKHKLDGKPLYAVSDLDALVVPVAIEDEEVP